MEGENEKKERVIHTRVPPSLDSELKHRAERLGVSVSNLVRNVLHHTFGIAEEVMKDTSSVARTARGTRAPNMRAEAESSASGPVATASQADAAPSRVLGWQRFTLGLNALCERCNAILPKGSEAGIGVLDGPGKRPVLCIPCTEELTRDEQH